MEQKKSGKYVIIALVLVFSIIAGIAGGILIGYIVGKNKNDNDFTVSDAFSCELLNGHCYHIPEISGNTQNILDINKQIWLDLYPQYEHAAQYMESHSTPDPAFINYTVGRKGDILSIVVLSSGFGDFIPEIIVYNVDIKKEVLLSDAETIAAFGYEEDTFYAEVKNAVEAVTKYNLENLPEIYEDDNFTSAITESYREETIRKCIPYINSYGIYCVSAYVFDAYLADVSYCLINLTTKKDEGFFTCEKLTHDTEENVTSEPETETEEEVSLEAVGEESISDNSESINDSIDVVARDREIYNKYFTSGGYSDFSVYTDAYNKNKLKFYSCLVDITDDDVCELLIYVENPENGSPRGTEKGYAFYTIKNGRPVKLLDAYDCGGSIGSEKLQIYLDYEKGEYFIMYSESVNDGYYAGWYTTEIYRSSSGFRTADEVFLRGRYATDNMPEYMEKIEEIKSQTKLYYYDDSIFCYYTYNGTYISKDQYDSMLDNNMNYILHDGERFLMREGTMNSPVAAIK